MPSWDRTGAEFLHVYSIFQWQEYDITQPGNYNSNLIVVSYTGTYERGSGSSDFSGLVAKDLGLYSIGVNDPDLKMFCIEYDTHQNTQFQDPDYDHAGITIVVATSVGFVNAGVNIRRTGKGTGVNVYSWIDYNGESKVLDDKSCVLTPILQLNHTTDLYNVMYETMWMRFLAGMGSEIRLVITYY
ncbi:hypothetical protein R1flu_017831 [Riccia fluitans]|uniref:Legume lectin domain-containing protein n=1 Tax=Riccia fluitans TaxID=41844 RepID=A0ABD1ZE34_9MARC